MTSSLTPSMRGDSSRPDDDQHLRGLLEGHGLRRTAQRIAVLQVLTDNADHHLTTAEIHEQLLSSGADVDLATVYRTITTLLNLGILHATAHTEQATSYGLAKESHHHAVCTRCGTVVKLSTDELQGVLNVTQQTTNFLLTDSVITVHGLCTDCQTT